jgi:hypothetical protein
VLEGRRAMRARLGGARERVGERCHPPLSGEATRELQSSVTVTRTSPARG